MTGPWQHLRRLLRELGRFQSIRPSDEASLSIDSRDVLARIMKADNSWESMVPAKVVEMIKSKDLFHCESADHFLVIHSGSSVRRSSVRSRNYIWTSTGRQSRQVVALCCPGPRKCPSLLI